ncbi:putative R3H and G-patch domain protein [Aspergillus alliaceus]|uniref:putative R3H and G-patch domain protein n=1 Tax=Petromyces alliaceus TaxID=209559 RepID=UPI0012A67851|nr:uncharacterized protein BDW43DRAFT_307732 [Aspergillus alliaceus]KAB8236707.1 hypothetical protein BDW43DRAFT_307732 [Aspergillus alliaceus]
MARHGKVKVRLKRQKPTSKASRDHQPGHLTMQQEARNTEGRNLWRPGSNLRHQGVRFVRAGNTSPDEQSEKEVTELEENLQQPPTNEAKSNDDLSNSKDEPATDNALFFIDLLGDRATYTGLADPTTALSLSECDDSSEDEVVFHGRRRLEARPHVIVEPGYVPKVASTTNTLPSTPTSSPKAKLTPLNPSACPARDVPQASHGLPINPPEKNSTQHKKTEGSHTANVVWKASADEDDDILDDYIANMAEHYYEDLHKAKANGPVRATGILPQNSQSHMTTSDSSDLTDKEKYPPGGSYPEHERDTTTLSELVLRLAGVEHEVNAANDVDIYPSDDAAASASNVDVDGLQVSDSDEKNMFDSDLDIEGLEALRRQVQGRYIRPQQKRGNSRGGFFASATAFADALETDPYYGLDIMDFNRPSLRKRQKGGSRALDMVLSDSELEIGLQNAWRNDREKKKARKQKREELRSQGLLSRGRHDPDLKSKYSNGIGFDDLKSEIRTFLMSARNSLALPPMTKHRRKLVHDLANELALGSQSRGKGSSRFPILHKTSRTPRHTQKTISHIDKIFSGGHSKRGAIRSWEQNVTKSAKSRRGRPDSSVSYMDGDIVGASAPEIGAENKGRAMLEKMGWSTGTALGATNNKGILLPVPHVVKNSKAGLG